MKLLTRNRDKHEAQPEDASNNASALDEEAPQPQPETEEPTLRDPGPTDLSKRDYVAIIKRAGKEAMEDNITNLAAALAYYAFLAIPSALLVGLGIFSLVADQETITSVVDKAGTVMPAQATELLQTNLTNMTEKQSTGIAIIGIGGLLAVWALGGAMQNVMWALNLAYERKETRGFVKRRLTAWTMLFFVLMGFALSFGLLVLGPHLSDWIGNAVDQHRLVSILWWVLQWPVLIVGLMLAFSGILYMGPNVDHPRWRFLTFGSVVALFIWLLASGLFSVYTSYFGSYNKTWGALSAVVILLTWFWLSALALLFGAEVNAEAERSRELRQGKPAEVELQAPAKA